MSISMGIYCLLGLVHAWSRYSFQTVSHDCSTRITDSQTLVDVHAFYWRTKNSGKQFRCLTDLTVLFSCQFSLF